MLRKITTREDEEKKAQRNRLIIGVVLVGIMILSSAGYAFYSADRTNDGATTETIEYEGVEFNLGENWLWNFKISGYDFSTRFNPEETQNISAISSKTLQNFYGKTLYFGTNSNAELSSIGNSEIGSNLEQFIGRSNLACIDESCTEDYPIKNCSQENVIIFREDKNGFSRVRDENSCVVIYYSKDEEQRAADAFLFKILGF